MKNLLVLLSVAALLSACAASKRSIGGRDLQQLKIYMTGSFNAAAQASRDSNYFDITLHMYPIWPNREGV